MHTPFENETNPEVVRSWQGWVSFTKAATIAGIIVAVVTSLVIAILTY